MSKMLLLNPRKRKVGKRISHKRKTYAKNPIITHHKRRAHRKHKMSGITKRHYRRNPIPAQSVMTTLTNAALGAGGALATDLVVGFLPLPAGTGPLTRNAIKGVVAIGLGMAAGKMIGRARGAKLAEGALTVILAHTAQGMLPARASGVAGLGFDDQTSLPALAAYESNMLAGLGAFEPNFSNV